MSIKENLDYIKEEMSTEEKFFESFFKLEKVWKKYKIVIIGGAALVILGFGGTNINEYLQTQTKIKANIAFNTLLENPQDASAAAVLKDANPKLFAILNHLTSKKNIVTNVQFIDEISAFNQALNKNDIDKLNKTLLGSRFLLKEYAMFQKALMQTLNKQYTDAKETLKLIPATSTTAQLANKLNHYLLTK